MNYSGPVTEKDEMDGLQMVCVCGQTIKSGTPFSIRNIINHIAVKKCVASNNQSRITSFFSSKSTTADLQQLPIYETSSTQNQKLCKGAVQDPGMETYCALYKQYGAKVFTENGVCYNLKADPRFGNGIYSGYGFMVVLGGTTYNNHPETLSLKNVISH